MGWLTPISAERKHLQRFYGASFLAEATNMAMPFKVLLAARYLGAERLAVVLAIEQCVALFLQVPIGAWADRFGRKKCVVAGHLIVVLGWFLVPAASWLHGLDRWGLVTLAFALLGAGAALIAGTQEAWAVDNLRACLRPDLIGRYFGRDRFWASAGGIVANLLTLALVAKVDIRLFWIVTGLGEVLAALVLASVPECTPEAVAALEPAPATTTRRINLSLLRAHPELVSLALVLTWVAATFGMSIETFQLALAGTRMSEHGFALLELAVNILGAVAPLAAIALLERFDAKRLLLVTILGAALVALSLAAGSRLGHLVTTYLLVRTLVRLFHTVADDFQHRLLSSAHRATASAAINFVAGLAQLGSAVVVAYLLHVVSAPTVLALMGILALPVVFLLVPPATKPILQNAEC
jgi:hypothetical protein